MNMSKAFARTTPFSDIQLDMRLCQRSLHSWGVGNSVRFDPGKEEFHILSRPGSAVDYSSFRLLGVKIDSKLLMREGVRALVFRAHCDAQACRQGR